MEAGELRLWRHLAYCALVPLIPFLPNIFYLIGLFFLMGISTGMLDVAMNAQAVMVEQLYKRPIMTSFHALFSIGMMLGAWCGSLFIDLGYDLGPSPDHRLGSLIDSGMVGE